VRARDVNPMAGFGAPWAAGNETAPRPARHLADRLCHDRCPALLPAHGHGQFAVMEGVEHRQVALARDAEYLAYAMDPQLIDEDLGGTAQIVLTAHQCLPGTSPVMAFAPPGPVTGRTLPTAKSRNWAALGKGNLAPETASRPWPLAD